MCAECEEKKQLFIGYRRKIFTQISLSFSYWFQTTHLTSFFQQHTEREVRLATFHLNSTQNSRNSLNSLRNDINKIPPLYSKHSLSCMCYNQTDVLWFIKQNENNLLLSPELDIFLFRLQWNYFFVVPKKIVKN